MKKAITLAIIGILLLITQNVYGKSPELSGASSFAASLPGDSIIAAELQDTLDATLPGEMVRVIVSMKDQVDLSSLSAFDRTDRLQKVIELLQIKAAVSQRAVIAYLDITSREGKVSEVISFWIFNGLAVEATPEVIAELAARRDVLRITPNESIAFLPDETTTDTVEPNIELINAPALWDLGYRGQGIVVASMDTGVWGDHPDLIAQWRGGANSWYDPYGENLEGPVDFSGHGTRTMGVMVGRSESGSAIGVAPEAQWIAVKIFNNQGSATTSGIHLGFQWLLDPDGDPSTPDAPHVVNNSWNYSAPGCNLEFQYDLHVLRAVGILPVFSAGNAGPYPSTSLSPANNPEAFAVGATDNYDRIYSASSRGPSTCGEETSIYPELVAPGVNILSSDRYGTYFTSSGTSLSAPHVSGGLALLLSAFPALSTHEQENALIQSAIDLGTSGPDNTFGFGRLDIYNAYLNLQGGGGDPPTPTTPTYTPIATFTPEPATTTPTSTPEPPTPTPTFTLTPTDTPTPTFTPEPPTPTATSGVLVNLAMGRPVSVSSYQDSSHTGNMAVDGSLETSWQTKKNSKLSSEWIQVDLGSMLPISQVVLRWDAKYAISYNVQVSQDNQSWTSLFSTTSGDGGMDSISFSTVEARYIKMESNAWIDKSQRCWLLEFEVLGNEASLPGETPTPTPSPTYTATPSLTPTPTSTQTSPGYMHIGDLDGFSNLNANRWDAHVLITAHSTDEKPAANATVSGTWSGGVNGSGTCTTDSSGQCSMSMISIRGNLSSVIFTVDNMIHSSLVYEPGLNHDPDGDSNGSVITIAKP
jgi:serine protease AprX